MKYAIYEFGGREKQVQRIRKSVTFGGEGGCGVIKGARNRGYGVEMAPAMNERSKDGK
jgi:hypothetical protein